ncbi:hypothetical protein TWF694_005318 [Orbilia ellipsospora]|uniref:F-box domain-containing protein n=1 Tax=Orbilia ellipsospora TaxID=2528407 RepID=A0AAV9WSR0_9PEZI
MAASNPAIKPISSSRRITDLPVEIQTQILSHLPLQSQVRAAKACKLWEKIVTEVVFKKQSHYGDAGCHELLNPKVGLTCEIRSGDFIDYFIGRRGKLHQLNGPYSRHLKEALEITTYKALVEAPIFESPREGMLTVVLQRSGERGLTTQTRELLTLDLSRSWATLGSLVHDAVHKIKYLMAPYFDRQLPNYTLEFFLVGSPWYMYHPGQPMRPTVPDVYCRIFI